MDESALQSRLDRIRRQQYLIIALLVVPYFVGLAELFGYASVGVAGVAFGLVAFAAFVAHRRRTRETTSG